MAISANWIKNNYFECRLLFVAFSLERGLTDE